MESEPQAQRLHSFHTLNCHQDYVRGMCYSPFAERLFSISADGVFMMNDIKE